MKKLLFILMISNLIPLVAMQRSARRGSLGAPLHAEHYQAKVNQKKQDQFVASVIAKDINAVKRWLKFRPQIDVNAPNSDMDRALDRAVFNKDSAMTELLIANGANVNQAMSGGMTPGRTLLMEAASKNDYPMVELLVFNGADTSATFNDNMNREGYNRKAIDFVIGNTQEARKIRAFLTEHSKQKIR